MILNLASFFFAITMKVIPKQAWSDVEQKAYDIVNAEMAEDKTMVEVYTAQMFDILDDLESLFGVHPATLSTRADYLNDDVKRLALYNEALLLAQKRGDVWEVNEINDSLRDFKNDL